MDPDVQYGGPGDDVMTSGGGDTGEDVLFGGPGSDTVFNTGGGNDTLHGDDGADILQSRRENDTLVGDAGPDVLIGDEEDDLVDGGSGDDRLHVRACPRSAQRSAEPRPRDPGFLPGADPAARAAWWRRAYPERYQ